VERKLECWLGIISIYLKAGGAQEMEYSNCIRSGSNLCKYSVLYRHHLKHNNVIFHKGIKLHYYQQLFVYFQLK
jgi:hypothetical protein